MQHNESAAYQSMAIPKHSVTSTIQLYVYVALSTPYSSVRIPFKLQIIDPGLGDRQALASLPEELLLSKKNIICTQIINNNNNNNML